MASIYAIDSTASPIAGSVVTTDSTGTFNFYVPDGRYDLTVNIGSSTKIVADLEIFDVTEANTGDVPVILNAKLLNNVRFADQFSGADAGAKIQAAHDDLPSTGGIVDATNLKGAQSAAATITLSKPCSLQLGDITLTLSGSPGITLSGLGASVGGLGRSVTTIKSNHATADLINLTAAFCKVESMTLDAAVARSGGAAAHVSGGSNDIFRDIRIHPNNIGFLFDTQNCGNNRVVDCHVGGAGTGGNWTAGIFIGNVTAGTISSNEFVNVFVTGEATFSNAMVVLGDGADGNQFTNCQMVSAGSGLSSTGLRFQQISGGLIPEWTMIENMAIEAGAKGNPGIQIDTARYVRMTGCYIGDCSVGLLVTAGTGIYFNGGIIFDNNNEGIKINGGSNVRIDNARICDNGLQTNNTFNDVLVAAAVTDWSVTNCDFGTVIPGGASTNKTIANVSVAAGASDRYRVEGCNFANIASGNAFVVDNGTGLNKSIRNPSNSNFPTPADFFPSGTVKIMGNANLPASTTTNLFLGGSYGSPILGKVYVGDGTGWELDFAKRTGSVDTSLVKFKDNGNIDLSAGKVSTYNAITTTGNGISTEYATVDLTAQGAAIGTTTLYAVPATGSGQYRLSWDSKITTVDTVSSTLGGLTITYTDPDGVVLTILAVAQHFTGGVVGTTNTGNVTTEGLLGFPLLLNCKASTNITYAFAYTSNTAGVMKYNLHLKLEAL